MAETRQITLGYWDIRGLGQPIRLMLKYTGTEFTDVRYDEHNDGKDWFDVKFKLGLDFPNLPYLIDGDLKLTQSFAILHHIARKHDLCGKTDKEMSLLGMLEHEAEDFRNRFTRMLYATYTKQEEYGEKRSIYLKQAKGSIKQFSQYLGGNLWFSGEKITYVDFYLYEILEHHRLFEPGIFDQVPNIENFLNRFEALPPIKAYMESKEFIRDSCNSYYCAWPGPGQAPQAQ